MQGAVMRSVQGEGHQHSCQESPALADSRGCRSLEKERQLYVHLGAAMGSLCGVAARGWLGLLVVHREPIVRDVHRVVVPWSMFPGRMKEDLFLPHLRTLKRKDEK